MHVGVVGAVASWLALVRSTPDRGVWVRALGGDEVNIVVAVYSTLQNQSEMLPNSSILHIF